MDRRQSKLQTAVQIFASQNICSLHTISSNWTYLINVQKRNKEVEAEVLDWISKVLGEPLPPGEFENILKDGVILCNLMNKLAPGSVKKIATKGTNFQLMENIQRFQAGMKAYGVPQEEIFQTADLFEKRNVAQVYGIKSFDSFC